MFISRMAELLTTLMVAVAMASVCCVRGGGMWEWRGGPSDSRMAYRSCMRPTSSVCRSKVVRRVGSSHDLPEKTLTTLRKTQSLLYILAHHSRQGVDNTGTASMGRGACNWSPAAEEWGSCPYREHSAGTSRHAQKCRTCRPAGHMHAQGEECSSFYSMCPASMRCTHTQVRIPFVS